MLQRVDYLLLGGILVGWRSLRLREVKFAALLDHACVGLADVLGQRRAESAARLHGVASILHDLVSIGRGHAKMVAS